MTVGNASPYAAIAAPYLAPDGREVVIVIVKATFVKGPNKALVLAAVQRPVRLGDVPNDAEVEQSSVRYPSDVGADKRGADVVFVGDAVATKPVTSMDVVAQVR